MFATRIMGDLAPDCRVCHATHTKPPSHTRSPHFQPALRTPHACRLVASEAKLQAQAKEWEARAQAAETQWSERMANAEQHLGEQSF